MDLPWQGPIAKIRPEHLRDAVLFADRQHMIESIGPQKADAVAEVGVAVGGFSQSLIIRFNPSVFWAIDTFELHKAQNLWGGPPQAVFGERTHAEYYSAVMSKYGEKLRLLQGDGAQKLDTLEDESVDLIYIDGSHRYDDVKRDAYAAVKKIKHDGIIIFNDYVLLDGLTNFIFGVVPVVNDLVVNHGWKVIGFALQENMYCDIAIQRWP